MSAELAQIDAAIASAAARLGPNHPQMQALRKQRALTQAQLARERAAASAGAAQAAQAGTAIMPGGCSPTFDGHWTAGQARTTAEAAGGGRLRSEEGRLGKECVSKCKSRWKPYH